MKAVSMTSTYGRIAFGALLAGALISSTGCTAELWHWASQPGTEIWPAGPAVVETGGGDAWIVYDFEGPPAGLHGMRVPADWHQGELKEPEGDDSPALELVWPLSNDWQPLASMPAGRKALVATSRSAGPGRSNWAVERSRNPLDHGVTDTIYAFHPDRKKWVRIATAHPGTVVIRMHWERVIIATFMTPVSIALDIVFGAFIVGTHSGAIYLYP